MSIDLKEDNGFFDGLYYKNLTTLYDSLLPSADIRIIKKDGSIEKVDQKIYQIAFHYLKNIATFFFSLGLLPFTWTISWTVGSLTSMKKDLIDRVNHPEKYEHPAQVKGGHIPEHFGFSSSRFQDSGEGTFLDLSSLKGIGTGDWDKILKRPVEIVSDNGDKLSPITHGITLKEGEKIEDLFINIIDHPNEFAELLSELGCTAYRTSLERSVMEPKEGQFSEEAIQKYHTLYNALLQKGITPWITLHHFTNPQWFEDQGGFTKEENIEGFVKYAEKMTESFPQIRNWMTFNEPGIRGLEAYVRAEHPPQHTSFSEASQVIRNILMAHQKIYTKLKQKDETLNIGLTHQWLRFLPSSRFNPIEKLTAFFFTNLIHSPVYNFFKDGNLQIKVPFAANVQLRYEDEATAKTQRYADFLGVQAYSYPRMKIAPTMGTKYPGAADKVNNLILKPFGIGFTAGSTCEAPDRMQFFGPPARSKDLYHVLDEAFAISRERIPEIGISETGRDARGMRHGDEGITSDIQFQAEGVREILNISQKYNLFFFFWWTLKRHLEWKSGSLPHLGLTDLKYDAIQNKYTYTQKESVDAIQGCFKKMQEGVHRQRRTAA